MEQTFCQSCGMPLTEEHFSTNADGTQNTTFCQYCYKNGQFTSDVTMDQMIEQCAQYLDEFNKNSERKLTRDEAIEQMKQYFPKLQRWQQ